MSEEVEFLIICKQCCEKVAPQVESNHGSPTSPLLLQGRDFPNPATASKLVGCKGSSASPGVLEHSSEVKSINRSAVIKKNGKLNWGLIWRKKNCGDTGIDFRLKNILLKGNADRSLIKPLCRLCNQPYNADLMYIHCETCKHWYHADSVGLDESKIFSLVGFKCCKCRRIKSPVCPFSDPEKRKLLKDEIESQQAAKLEISAMDFDCSMITDHHKEVEPACSALPRKGEVIHVATDNLLLASLSEVKQCTEGKTEVKYGWKDTTVSDSGPRKLPVRRHANQEKDVFSSAGPFQLEASAPFEANVFNSSEKMPVRTSIKREANLDHHSAANSFMTEISILSETNAVASDDGGHANGNEPPEDVVEDLKSSSTLPENGTPKTSYHYEKPIIYAETAIQIAPCKLCSNTDPCPDLSCQICGMRIHRLCSPWFETSSFDDGWRCGNCREWR